MLNDARPKPRLQERRVGNEEDRGQVMRVMGQILGPEASCLAFMVYVCIYVCE